MANEQIMIAQMVRIESVAVDGRPGPPCVRVHPVGSIDADVPVYDNTGATEGALRLLGAHMGGLCNIYVELIPDDPKDDDAEAAEGDG